MCIYLSFAVEVANPSDESAEVEGFEIESLLLLPFGGDGHNEKEDKSLTNMTTVTAMDTAMTTMMLSRLGSLQLWKSRKKAVLATVPWK